MDITLNLMQGKLRWFSLSYPFLPHPPLYFLISGFFLQLFGSKLLAMRFLSVFLSLSSIFLIYFLAKEIFNYRIALISAFIYSIYPDIIFWNRMAYAHNLLAVFVLLAIFLVWRYVNCRVFPFPKRQSKNSKKYLYSLSLLLGLGLVTEFLGIGILFSVLFVFWYYGIEWKKLFILSMPIPLLFTFSMLLIMPQAFLHDLLFQLERIKAFYAIFLLMLISLFYFCLSRQLKNLLSWLKNLYKNIAYDTVSLDNLRHDEKTKRKRLAKNILLLLFFIHFFLALTLIYPFDAERLVGGTIYLWIGFLGIMNLGRDNFPKRKILFLFSLRIFFLVFFIGRTDHMLIPLYPLFSLGLAIILDRLYSFLTSLSSFQFFSLVAILLLIYPFPIIIYQDFSLFFLQQISSEDIEARKRITQFINNNTTQKDLVLADSHFPRFLICNSSVLLQAAAFEGRDVYYMAPDYGKERFIINPSLSKAKFVVLEKRRTKTTEDNLPKIWKEIKNWPTTTLSEAQQYIIYRNPHLT